MGCGIDACNCNDNPVAVIMEGDASWHDGAGWYYVDDEYRDEGSCGAFKTRFEAEDHAREAGYFVAPHKPATPSEREGGGGT